MTQQKLPFVWEIDNSGIISYLVGTDHFARDIYKQDVERRLSGIEQVLLEIVVRDENKAELEDSIKNEEKNSTLAGSCIEQLTMCEQEKIAEIFGLPLLLIKYLPLIILKGYILAKSMPQETRAVDTTIQETAQEKNIKIFSLETLEEQFSALRQNCIEEGVEDFKNWIKLTKQFGSINQFHRQLRQAYEIGDIETIKKMLTEDDIITKKIGINRNIILATRSIPYLQRPTMVAVGATHCIIEPTMQDIYANNGIKIRRID